MHLLGAETISLSYPNRTVLDEVTIGVNAGDRVGIVGRNGDGKSTLVTILAGIREPDSGRVTRRRDVTTGYLHQTDDFAPGSSIRQAVVGDAADHEWAAVPRIRDVMSGLLGDLDLEATVDSLSGGQRRRVALAALLAGDHDVLFLDEPTNHLDVEGIAWLARHLKNRWPAGQGAFLVVTHDRWFLDEVTTNTWEVHDGTVDQYEGGYAAYVLQRLERRRLADQAEAKRQNLMRKELAWLRRGAPARTSKPKFRIDAANALIADVPPVRNKVELVGMATSRLGKDVFELTDVGVDYPGKTVLDDLDWVVGPGDRIGILGRNGAGKSTLAGLLTGDVEPTRGRVKRGKTVAVAVLDQQLRDLEPLMGEFVRELLGRKKTEYKTAAGDLTPGQLAEKLGLGDVLANRVQDLSGGQRRRLQFLLTLLDEPNVLILDEPTNDMDTDMLAAMEDLLDTWAGTLLVISHDRYFMERVTDDQFAVRGGGVRHLPGGIDEYLRLSAAQDSAEAAARAAGGAAAGGSTAEALAGSPSSGTGRGPSGGGGASGGGPSNAERRAAQKELGAVERKMSRLQKSVDDVHARMAAHDQSDFAGLAELTQEQQGFEAELEELEERWLELSETLE